MENSNGTILFYMKDGRCIVIEKSEHLNLSDVLNLIGNLEVMKHRLTHLASELIKVQQKKD
jgi:hypothetical protein